eukprot:CAMPEP_0181263110 /NCGR_PEP_ID=MMETSP1097-20121128/2403_1 /TAXON_ID=35684 /ORGANISM="Pseudopedinella elastica, Strain CCMP716" /LENGTH=70 /DNA_ID=CAMNT_0023361871 /DNA_START=133 /DNA_END=342 /DNA_ORIENTATION=+
MGGKACVPTSFVNCPSMSFGLVPGRSIKSTTPLSLSQWVSIDPSGPCSTSTNVSDGLNQKAPDEAAAVWL